MKILSLFLIGCLSFSSVTVTASCKDILLARNGKPHDSMTLFPRAGNLIILMQSFRYLDGKPQHGHTQEELQALQTLSLYQLENDPQAYILIFSRNPNHILSSRAVSSESIIFPSLRVMSAHSLGEEGPKSLPEDAVWRLHWFNNTQFSLVREEQGTLLAATRVRVEAFLIVLGLSRFVQNNLRTALDEGQVFSAIDSFSHAICSREDLSIGTLQIESLY